MTRLIQFTIAILFCIYAPIVLSEKLHKEEASYHFRYSGETKALP